MSQRFAFHTLHKNISLFRLSRRRTSSRKKKIDFCAPLFLFAFRIFFSLLARLCLRGGLVREFLRINSARIKKMRTKRSKNTCCVGQTYRRETFSSVASDSSSQSQSLSVFVRPWLLRCIYPKSRTSLFSNLEWNTSARLNR